MVCPPSVIHAAARRITRRRAGLLGKKDEARTAYTDALTNLDPNAPNRSFIEMKRNDLGNEEKKGS